MRRLALAVALMACSGGSTAGVDAAVTDDAADDAPAGEAGGSGLDPYGNCVGAPRRVDDGACAGPLVCLPSYSRAYGESQWCASPCDPARMGADCPAPPAGARVTVQCVVGDPPDPATFCRMSCQFTPDGCPRGMVCYGGFYCAWPR